MPTTVVDWARLSIHWRKGLGLVGCFFFINLVPSPALCHSRYTQLLLMTWDIILQGWWGQNDSPITELPLVTSSLESSSIYYILSTYLQTYVHKSRHHRKFSRTVLTLSGIEKSIAASLVNFLLSVERWFSHRKCSFRRCSQDFISLDLIW